MSSIRKTVAILAITISLAAVSFTQDTRSDYDRNTDFSQYKTFSFEKVQTEHPFWSDRVRSAVAAALTAKGLVQVSSAGDIAIIAIGMTKDQQTLDSFYESYANGWGWNWGGGYGEETTTPAVYSVGSLVVDLFDAKKKKLIWRGSETNALSDQSSKSIKYFNKGVEKLFRQYPPKV
jgi:hypothetical protein